MKPHFVYLIQILTYGVKHPIKIGISKNVEKRLHNLQRMFGCPKLLGVFHCLDIAQARAVERMALKQFPRDEYYGQQSREVLDVSFDELRNFIESNSALKFMEHRCEWAN